MADSTPEQQFSLLSQQLLLLNELPQHDDAHKSLEVEPTKPHNPREKTHISSAALSCSAGDEVSLGQTTLKSAGEAVNLDSMETQAHPAVKPELQDATVKSQRLQQMQMALIEHQSQLLRQREHLQQQQRLLLQRSQERNVAPNSLAQLFADLHEARQQQYLLAQQRTDPTTPVHIPDGRVLRAGRRHHCSTLPSNGAGLPQSMPPCAADAAADLTAKHDGKPTGEQTQETEPEYEPCHAEEFRSQQQKAPPIHGQFSSDRRRLLRDAGLLDARAVLSCTVSALQFCRRNTGGACPQGTVDSNSERNSGGAMQSSSDSGSLGGCPTFSRASGQSASTTTSWGGCTTSPGTTGGKVIQVHGEPLPLTVLCAGISPEKLWLHCLRVTLHARRCAIRTRSYWKALVHLFPRRSAYSTMAVLSEEDLNKYSSIGPRGASSLDAAAALGSWAAPTEPFCEPGLYCLIDESGPILAAWAVARDSNGRLRRCSAMVGSGEVEDKAIKKKRCKYQENDCKSCTTDTPWGAFLRGKECVEAEGLQALEKWYVDVANEPLTEQQIRSLTLAEYVSVFGEYAECLVNALQKLIETRRAPSYASKGAEGCGCSCSICVGQPCRVRLAWRQHLMAFELAIDKTAAARSRSDSSGEESVGAGGHGIGRSRTVAALRSHKGHWEWCRKCALGCRMQLHLILHELYQPLSLTRPGLRSALAQLLTRLRRYVTLSPLGVEFLMQRLKEMSSIPAFGAGFQDVFSQAREGDDDDLTGSCCSWATRDWAQACWHRRQQRCQTDVPSFVIGSNNLDSSIGRLSMLSATLWEAPASTTEATTEPGRSAEGGETERKRASKADISAEELQALADGMARQDCPTVLGGPGIHTLQVPGLSDIVANPDDEEEGARSPQYSSPVSIASSQVPSACRDDLGRPAHGGDGFGGDGVDASPRRLRRMQRARLTSEDQQATSGHRRVTPLVPWWWEDYVRTGIGQDEPGSDPRGRGGKDAASDSSSSVNSTISLAASPHVFRIPCGSVTSAPYLTADIFPWQTRDTGAEAMLARFSEAVDSQSRSGLHRGINKATNAAGGDGVDLSVELIHAAAELVDSIESWPAEFEPQRIGVSTKAHQSRGLALGERTDNTISECTLPASETAAASAPSAAGRKAKPSKGSEGASSAVVQSSNTGSMLTFVSAVLTVPTGNEIDCINGFELLQGTLRALFGSASPFEGSQLKAVNPGTNETTVERTTAAQQGVGVPLNHAVSVMQMATRDADAAEEGRRCVAEARSEAAQRSDNAPPALDLSVTTPLLRSLAASSAPPVENAQDQLLVDDFYALPLLRGALRYRDAYDPFERDYTDAQIRLKPMRAFGRRQDRHNRHRRRSWRLSSQSAGSSPRGNSPVPSRPQGTTGLGLRKPIQGSARGRGFGALAERTGTVRIGGRRVVVRTVDDGASWASREPSAGGLSDFSLSRCSMSVDSSISSRGVSVCSRATSNAGSVSDASVQGGGTPQSPGAHEGAPRHKRGRSRPPPGGRGSGGGGNSSTPTGVYLDVARKLWRCQWRENGRFKTKSFPLNQYKTLKEARRACVVFRCLMGGWEVQPAWLGDDEGGDIDMDQPEGFSEPSGNNGGTEEAKSTAAAP
ncbi:hypothetical protein, conserved [Eimeria praecox]|uniref:AP2/ERF domain-containing protein n=1 Tax=Eimeria praecox TaxID=51316 RepID=U6G5G0_9EIME|nr:hypothetical protein, conserved [Eimeria praecox]